MFIVTAFLFLCVEKYKPFNPSCFCVCVWIVFLLGGGEDKGRLWWWEQEGKATIPENRRVLNKHHWRCIWAAQSKHNVAAIVCVSYIIPFPLSLALPQEHMPESSCLPAAEDICHHCHNISSPVQVILCGFFMPPSCPVSCAACHLFRLHGET